MSKEGEPTRFLVLGGFLGAGKTTLAVNLAKTLREVYDKSVAIITNDQGDVLVDTEFTKDAGFDVEEVLGGCFCGRFEEFVSSARSLVDMGRPDIIIAEPIGTSTNILASVVTPLRTLYPDEFSVAPLTVVVDCVRAMGILAEDKKRDEESVDLIPAHQIVEAEMVVLSKADMVDEAGLEEIKAAVRKVLPDVEIVPTSSLDLRNIKSIVEMLLSDRLSEKLPDPENNQKFAFEKAKLGWYSSTFEIRPEGQVDMYGVITDIMRSVAGEYGPRSIAHVKVIVSSEDAAAKMSLVEESMQVDGIHGSRFLKGDGRMVLNARVISPPRHLQEVMDGITAQVDERYGLNLKKVSEACFSPRPESPSHFFAN